VIQLQLLHDILSVCFSLYLAWTRQEIQRFTRKEMGIRNQATEKGEKSLYTPWTASMINAFMWSDHALGCQESLTKTLQEVHITLQHIYTHHKA